MTRIVYTVGSLLLLATWAHAIEVSFEPQYWKPDLTARARIEKMDVGEEINFSKDLGMDDQGVLGGTVDLALGLSGHLMLSYWSADYDGDKVLSKTFEYNGRTYAAGSRVKSSFDFDAVEFGYANDFHDYQTHRAGFLLGLNWYAIDTALTTNDPAVRSPNDDKIDVVFPMAGGRFWLGFMDNKVQLAGQLAGLWWQGSGWWDAQASLSIQPIEMLKISGGYRYVHLDLSNDDDSANLKLRGPMISVTLFLE